MKHKELININSSSSRFFPGRSEFRELALNEEANIGGELFVEKKQEKDLRFYCLDRNKWIYCPNESNFVVYKITPSGVIKQINSNIAVSLSNHELKRFLQAARAYTRLVKQQIYKPVLSEINRNSVTF